MGRSEKSSEQYEAGDIIEELKTSRGQPGVCPQHHAVTSGIIWIIRHLDLEERRDGRNAEGGTRNAAGGWRLQIGNLKAAGLPALVIAIALVLVGLFQWTQSRAIRAEIKQSAQETVVDARVEAHRAVNEAVARLGGEGGK